MRKAVASAVGTGELPFRLYIHDFNKHHVWKPGSPEGLNPNGRYWKNLTRSEFCLLLSYEEASRMTCKMETAFAQQFD